MYMYDLSISPLFYFMGSAISDFCVVPDYQSLVDIV